jgi:hypothetical protein
MPCDTVSGLGIERPFQYGWSGRSSDPFTSQRSQSKLQASRGQAAGRCRGQMAVLRRVFSGGAWDCASHSD